MIIWGDVRHFCFRLLFWTRNEIFNFVIRLYILRFIAKYKDFTARAKSGFSFFKYVFKLTVFILYIWDETVFHSTDGSMKNERARELKSILMIVAVLQRQKTLTIFEIFEKLMFVC